MKLKVFSVLDAKVGSFAAPFFMRSSAEALRAFHVAASDRESMISKHPEDFSLYLIGEFDDDTGALAPCTPENLGFAVSLLTKGD